MKSTAKMALQIETQPLKLYEPKFCTSVRNNKQQSKFMGNSDKNVGSTKAPSPSTLLAKKHEIVFKQESDVPSHGGENTTPSQTTANLIVMGKRRFTQPSQLQMQGNKPTLTVARLRSMGDVVTESKNNEHVENHNDGQEEKQKTLQKSKSSTSFVTNKSFHEQFLRKLILEEDDSGTHEEYKR